ncbi:MAG: hypothetical protein WDO16_10075 [Bacteroidota bacterium]
MKKKNQTTITAVPGKQEFFITREFEAPRELVFKALLTPNYCCNGWARVT